MVNAVVGKEVQDVRLQVRGDMKLYQIGTFATKTRCPYVNPMRCIAVNCEQTLLTDYSRKGRFRKIPEYAFPLLQRVASILVGQDRITHLVHPDRAVLTGMV